MSWWHNTVAVQWNFNRYACGLGTIQSNMPPGPLEIKEKSYLTDARASIRHAKNTVKLISQDYYIVNTAYMPCRELLCRCSCNIYACWPSVTVTTTAAVQTCPLVENCCKMGAWWPVATQSACLLTLPFVFQYCMCAGVVLLYLLYLLVWCLTISRVCWYGVSLSAVPAGVVNN